MVTKFGQRARKALSAAATLCASLLAYFACVGTAWGDRIVVNDISSLTDGATIGNGKVTYNVSGSDGTFTVAESSDIAYYDGTRYIMSTTIKVDVTTQPSANTLIFDCRSGSSASNNGNVGIILKTNGHIGATWQSAIYENSDVDVSQKTYTSDGHTYLIVTLSAFRYSADGTEGTAIYDKDGNQIYYNTGLKGACAFKCIYVNKDYVKALVTQPKTLNQTQIKADAATINDLTTFRTAAPTGTAVTFSNITWDGGTALAATDKAELTLEPGTTLTMDCAIPATAMFIIKSTGAITIAGTGDWVLGGNSNNIFANVTPAFLASSVTITLPVRQTLSSDYSSYTGGGGTESSRIDIGTSGGTVNLDGGTYYLAGGSAFSGTPTVVNITHCTLNYSEKIGVGQAVYTIGGNTTVTTPMLWLSQGLAGRTAVFTVKDDAKVTVTGNAIADQNTSSIMFGHYNGPSTFTLRDNATFMATDAQVLVGKTSNTQTINLEGGVFTAKGIKVSSGAHDTNNTLNFSGTAKLCVGANGIGTYATNKKMTINVSSGSPTLTASDDYPVAFAPAVASGATLNVDSAGHNITLAASVTGDGELNVQNTSGSEGSVIITGAYAGSATISSGKLDMTGATLSGSVTVATDGTLDLSGGTVAMTSPINNNGTVIVSADTRIELSGMTGTETGNATTYTIISGDGTTSGDLTKACFTMNGYPLSSRDIVVDGSTYGTIVVTFAAALDLTWDGGDSGQWTLDSNTTNWRYNSNNYSFGNGDSAIFATENATATLANDILVGTVTVNETATIDLNSHQLAATDIAVATGKQLTVNGVSGGGLTVENPIAIPENAVVQFNHIAPAANRKLQGTESNGAGTVVLDNSGAEIGISGGDYITGALALEKTGGTKISIYSSQGYTGGTKIKGGNIGIGNGSALGSGNVTLAGGGIVLQNGDYTLSNNFNVPSGSSGTLHSQSYTLTATGTMTIDAGATLHKAGSGTAILSNNTLANNGTFNITEGTLQIKNSNNTAGASKTINAVTLASGANLQLYSGGYGGTDRNAFATKINAMTLSGNATISETNYGGSWRIGSLFSPENASTELTMQTTHSADNFAVFELGGIASVSDTGNFNGTIKLDQNQSGKNRHTAIVITDSTIAQNAVVDFTRSTSAEGGNTAVLGLGVNAANVRIAGLKGSLSSKTSVFAGTISDNNGGKSNTTFQPTWASGTVVNNQNNILTINTANSTSYSYDGNFQAGIDIVKDGSGTQIFSAAANSNPNFNGTVEVAAGTLTIAKDSFPASTPITVKSGATLVITGVGENDDYICKGVFTFEDGAKLMLGEEEIPVRKVTCPVIITDGVTAGKLRLRKAFVISIR